MIGTKSLMTREESTAMKGLLMVLIVLCHNALLNNSLVDGSLLPHRRFIYLFHSTCFFILPIMYGYTYKYGVEHRWRNIIDYTWRNFVRCWVPYTWFFFLIVCVCLFLNRELSLSEIMNAYIIGTPSILSSSIHNIFLWFLPSMFAVSLIKTCWYNSIKCVKFIVVLLGMALMTICILGKTKSVYLLENNIPFSLVLGLRFFTIAFLVRGIIEWFGKITVMIACSCFLVIFTLLFFINNNVDLTSILRWLMPISVFPLLYYSRTFLIRAQLLITIGKYSLYIYLTHIFVYYLVNPLLLLFFTNSYYLGIISFIITLTISIGVSYLIDNSKLIKKLLFARS